jgi:hypothetical protein
MDLLVFRNLTKDRAYGIELPQEQTFGKNTIGY